MSLADMGADVIRVERPGGSMFSNAQEPRLDFLNRGKRCICVDLKTPEGVDTILELVGKADALLEGNRPGVMERLGLGPDICLETNPALVYGRMTGWGQEGPMAQAAGHDLNYVALAGALHPMGRAALLEAKTSGEGQVVDAAMIDGAATLMASTFAASQAGFWREERGTNFLDGGAHFYEVYETADGRYISLGSIEPQFYAALLEILGDDAEHFQNQWDMDNWPAMKDKMAEIIARKTRDEWDAVFEGVDVCYAPVLSISEVRHHPHHQARGTFIDDGDYWQPGPAPRFSRTGAELRGPSAKLGQHTEEILRDFGFSDEQIAAKLASGAVVGSS
jgi:alpha-methylacyl-CoA racemase